jgi:hypothetical protein
MKFYGIVTDPRPKAFTNEMGYGSAYFVIKLSYFHDYAYFDTV